MSASSTAREGRILEDLAGVVAPLHVVIEDVRVMPAGKRRLVRVLVDRDLSDLDPSDTTSSVDPLDLDQVAEVTRMVSDRMDEADHMGDQAYTLEVSSPGVDRPLTEPRHYRRNVGRMVTVTGVDESSVTGRLIEAGDDGIRVRVEGPKGQVSEQQMAYDDCARAVVQVEFNRPSTAEDGEDG